MRVEAPGRWRCLSTGGFLAHVGRRTSGAGRGSCWAAFGMLFLGWAVALIAVVPPSAAATSASPSPLTSPVASATPVTTASPAPISSASPGSGAAIFASNCAVCHGPRGAGAGVGPSLRADAFAYIVAQKVDLGGQGMPPFAALFSADETKAVSGYVAQDLADPEARLATIAEGGTIFRLYCAGCHGVAGRGGAIGRGRNAPSYANRPAANALAAMLRGPFNMPVFSSTLDVRQQAAVARYVYALKPPASPGGYGLGYAGPVAEGAVAAAGLLVLVLMAVWLAAGKGDSARD